MSLTTTFAALPQDLVDICASYIWPPELDFMATYPPAGTRAAEAFAKFATSYEASVTWDLQAGIDPNDPQSKGKGKAIIQKRYEELNAHIKQKKLVTIIDQIVPAGTNVFRSHALMQGVLIGQAVSTRNWEFASYDNGPGPQLLLQLTCCPVYALAADGTTEELSEEFYGPGLLSCGKEAALVQAVPTARRYSTFIQASYLFGRYLKDDGLTQLYLDHGGFQDLGTLQAYLKRLMDDFRFSNPHSADTITPSLGLFQRHFRNVMLALDNTSSAQDNKSVSKFLFKWLREILELSPGPARELLARVFREELVRRNFLSEQELHKKYLWYSEPFDLLDIEDVVTHFLGHLWGLERNKQQHHGSAGVPVAISSLSVDEDENTQGYLSLIRRLFQEVITPMGNGTPRIYVLGEARQVLYNIIRRACAAPPCQAACVLFTLAYNEIRRRNLRDPNGNEFNGKALKAGIEYLEIRRRNLMELNGNKFNNCRSLIEIIGHPKNPALVQLFLEIAAKEEELNPLRAIHDPNTAAFDKHFNLQKP